MPTPRKPYEVLSGEGRSHRTKVEMETRRRGETAALTGKPMGEWSSTRGNAFAHKQFLRIRGNLRSIKRDDALYEAVINRYCVMLAEEVALREDRDWLEASQRDIERLHSSGEIEDEEYRDMLRETIGRKLDVDKALDVKRKALLSIEKDNIMTIVSALRSVKLDTDDDATTADPMEQLLNSRIRRA